MPIVRNLGGFSLWGEIMKNFKQVIAMMVVMLLIVGLLPARPVFAIPSPTTQSESYTTTESGTQDFTIALTTSFTTPSAVTIETNDPGVSGVLVTSGSAVEITLNESATANPVVLTFKVDGIENHILTVEIDYYFRNFFLTDRDMADVDTDNNGLRVMYYDLTIPKDGSAESISPIVNTLGQQKYPGDPYIVRTPKEVLVPTDLDADYLDQFSDLWSSGVIDDVLYYYDNESNPADNDITTVENPYYQGTYNWGYFIPRYTGMYSIGVRHDDGIEVTITDEYGTEMVTNWALNAPKNTLIDELYFVAGRAYPIDVMFYENNKVKVSFVLLMEGPGGDAGTEAIPGELLFPAKDNRSPRHDPLTLDLLGDNPFTVMFGTPYAEPGYVSNGDVVVSYEYVKVHSNSTTSTETVAGINHMQLGHYIITYTASNHYDSMSKTRDVMVIPGEGRVNDFVYFIGDKDLVRYYPFYYNPTTMKYGRTELAQEDAMNFNTYASIGTLMNGRVVGHKGDNLYIDIDTPNSTELTWPNSIDIPTNAMTIDDEDILYLVKNSNNGDTKIHTFMIDQRTNIVTKLIPEYNIGKWDSIGDIEVFGEYAYVIARKNGNEKIVRVDLNNGSVNPKNVDEINNYSYALTEVRDALGNEDFMLFARKSGNTFGLLLNNNDQPYLSMTMFEDVDLINNDIEDGARGIRRGDPSLLLNDLTLYETETGNVFNPSSYLAGYEITYSLMTPSDSAYLSIDPITGDVEALMYTPDPIIVKAMLHDGFGTMTTASVTILDLYYTVKVTGPTEVFVPDLDDPAHPTKYVPYSYEAMDQLGNGLVLIDPVWSITNSTNYMLTTSPSTNVLIVPSTGETEMVKIDITGDYPPVDQAVMFAPPHEVNVKRVESFTLTLSGETPVYIPSTFTTVSATEIYLTTLEDNFGTDYTSSPRDFELLMRVPAADPQPLGPILFHTDEDTGDKFYIHSYGRVTIDDNGVLTVEPYIAGTSYEGMLYVGVEYTDVDVSGVLEIEVIKAPYEYTLTLDGPTTITIPTTTPVSTTGYVYVLGHQYATGLALSNPVWDVTGHGVTMLPSTLVVGPEAEDVIPIGENEITVTVSVMGDEHSTPATLDVLLVKQDPNKILTITGVDDIQIPMSGNVPEFYNYTYTDQYGTARTLIPSSITWEISSDLSGVSFVGGNAPSSLLTVDSATVPHMVRIELSGEDSVTEEVVTTHKYVQILPKQMIPTLVVMGADSIVIPGTLEPDAIEDYTFYLRLMVPTIDVDLQAGTFSVTYTAEDILVPSDADSSWELESPYAGVSSNLFDVHIGQIIVSSGTQTGFVTGVANVLLANMDVFDGYDVYPDDYDLQGSKQVELEMVPVPTRLFIEGPDSILIPRFYDPISEETYIVHLYDQYDQDMDISEVYWDLVGSPEGVSFDPRTGIMTVSETATVPTIVIYAEWPAQEGGDNGPAIFTLTALPEFLSDTKVIDLIPQEIDYYSLNFTIVGNGSVSVDPAEDEGGYMHGTVVDLTATPDPGWTFSGFSAPVSGNQITMDNNYTITALFVPIEQPPTPVDTNNLTITIVGNGAVSPQSSNFDEGTVVQLTFTPDDGWEFVSVSGPVDGANQIIMDQDYAITVTFGEIIIPDNPTPLAPPEPEPDPVLPEPEEEIIDIEDPVTPLADLPQTSGIDQMFFYFTGGLFILLGSWVFNRRNKSHN